MINPDMRPSRLPHAQDPNMKPASKSYGLKTYL